MTTADIVRIAANLAECGYYPSPEEWEQILANEEESSC